MRSKIGAGIVAGLAGGVILALSMALMQTPRPSGDQPSLLFRVERLVGSDSTALGWFIVIAGGAVLGGVLALVLGARAANHTAGVIGGLLLALTLWVVVMVAVPVVSKARPFSPLWIVDAFPVAVGSLLGLILYGAMLGFMLPWLLGRRR